MLNKCIFLILTISDKNILRAVTGECKAFSVRPREHLNAEHHTHQRNFGFPNHFCLFQFHAAPPQWKRPVVLINLICLRSMRMG